MTDEQVSDPFILIGFENANHFIFIVFSTFVLGSQI